MISSTMRDLPKHRQMALDACLRQDFLPKMMEHLPASPDDAVHESLRLVDQADVYVLILGMRYGTIPSGYDKSYTHLELDRAIEGDIPTIILVSSDEHVFAPRDIDLGSAGEKILRFREAVRERGAQLFSDADDMRAQLIHSLSTIRHRLDRPPTPTPHYVHQPEVPPVPFVAHPYTLLETGAVVGREQELNLLTDWVSDRTASVFASRIVILVAIGGIGKSALAWKWFNEIAPLKLPGLAGRVWWSFYETDATFENFVTRSLAYVTASSIQQVEHLRTPEREHALLAALGRAPYLVVLDGLERLLLAYSREDAARLADNDLDEETANWVAGARGLPASAAASFTGQTRLRLTADPRVGAFLKRLAGIEQTRVLITSRLYPRELQTPTMQPMAGVHPFFMGGLTPNDAVQLWRRLGGSGGRAELIELFAAFDNYPLLIRALASEVARFRRAPGNLTEWRKSNPGFDPFRLPLIQRKSHVLEYALGGLTNADQRILHTVAAFRAPTDYDTLSALLVGEGRPGATEAELDRALTELEDRGLLGWDRRGNRYDLHPVVRGVAWAGLEPDARHGIDLQLASHFESIPAIDANEVRTVDDLSVPIELYHTLLRLGRYEDAFAILDGRLMGQLFCIGAYRQLAELAAAPNVIDPRWSQSIRDERGRVRLTSRASTLIGLGYQLTGDPGRADQGYHALMSTLADLSDRGSEQNSQIQRVKALRALTYCQLGHLAQADQEAREALAMAGRDGSGLSLEALAMGVVCLRRGQHSDGCAWLSDYRSPLHGGMFRWLARWELGLTALSDGDLGLALRCYSDLSVAKETRRPFDLYVMILRGAVDRRMRISSAGEQLTEALLTSRSIGLSFAEITALTELAGWHRQENQLDAAREHAADAVELADRAQLRLCSADALNMLSSIERQADNREAAVLAARAAYRQAWCDGPPYSYSSALTDARTNLAALDEPEPTGLSRRDPCGPSAEIAIRPLPPLPWIYHLHAWPGMDETVENPLGELRRSGLRWASYAVLAALAKQMVGADGAPVRKALLSAEEFGPYDRLALAVWLSRQKQPEAGPALRRLVDCPDPAVHRGAIVELAREFDPRDRRLLYVGLDGRGPLVDLSELLTMQRMAHAASIMDEPPDVLSQRYERLANLLGLRPAPAADEPTTDEPPANA
jgi:tetratricopeptide (TPR) repeat protein